MTPTHRHIRPQESGPDPLDVRVVVAILGVLIAGWSAVAWYAGRVVGWW